MSDTPGVQQILATDSMLPEIPFRGKLFKVGRPDGNAKGRLEKLVKKVVIDEVRALQGTLDPAAYRELFDAKTRSLKEYDTWRAGWQAVVFDPANAHLFLWSLLQEFHPDITESDVRAMGETAPEEVQYALAQVVPDFFTILLAGLDLTPDQRNRVMAVLEMFRARLTPSVGASMPSATAA